MLLRCANADGLAASSKLTGEELQQLREMLTRVVEREGGDPYRTVAIHSRV